LDRQEAKQIFVRGKTVHLNANQLPLHEVSEMRPGNLAVRAQWDKHAA
jgi:hypothetical protein